MKPELNRYSRQVFFEGVGEQGQEALLGSTAVVLGCGALGTVSASILARAGVGTLRIVDRDFIEETNLQRQVLFNEEDIKAGLPKSEAARLKLQKVNSQIQIESHVADINYTNILQLIEGANVVIDGTDNFETRFLINDACHKTNTPWIYGACIGSTGLMMNVIPGQTPCLRCVYETAPPPEMSPSCDTAGILGSIVNIVASYQITEAIKLLVGKRDRMQQGLLHMDVWEGTHRILKVGDGPLEACPTCTAKEYEYLEARSGSQTTSLCGRNAVQVTQKGKIVVNFPQLQEKLSKLGKVNFSKFMLKFEIDAYTFTVFPDGRAIIQGTNDAAVARNLYAKYIGH